MLSLAYTNSLKYQDYPPIQTPLQRRPLPHLLRILVHSVDRVRVGKDIAL